MDKAYSTEIENLEDLNKYLGKEIGISEWFEMSQDKVNSFAELTQDKQWIHIDQEKAAKYSPYKKTCLLYTSPSPRDRQKSRMPSSA